MTTTVHPSPLDRPYPQFEDKPFFDLTLSILRSVRDHDQTTLARICDDDFGIVGLTPDGDGVVVRNQEEHATWFGGLFAQLDALGARTDSEVLGYEAVEGADLGYSVVGFRLTLELAGSMATFDCITTIVWKLVDDEWREARWHGSVVSSDVPEALRSVRATAA